MEMTLEEAREPVTIVADFTACWTERTPEEEAPCY